MTAQPKRINVTLDAQQAEKLARMAERTHLQEGTLARSLLSVAIDVADADAAHVHAVLSSIPGSLDRAKAGSREIQAGEGVAAGDV